MYGAGLAVASPLGSGELWSAFYFSSLRAGYLHVSGHWESSASSILLFFICHLPTPVGFVHTRLPLHPSLLDRGLATQIEAMSPTPSRDRSSFTPSPLPSYASDHEESTYLLNTKRLHRARLVLSTIILAASAAVIGCEAHALSQYNATHLSSEWWLPLWPQHFDIRPTRAILISGGIIAALSLIYIFGAMIPSVRSPSLLTEVD